jgi:hypothetical protein
MRAKGVDDAEATKVNATSDSPVQQSYDNGDNVEMATDRTFPRKQGSKALLFHHIKSLSLPPHKRVESPTIRGNESQEILAGDRGLDWLVAEGAVWEGQSEKVEKLG